MSAQHSRHDQLFRDTFSIPIVARQFLEAWLPVKLLAIIDWPTLRVESISGINQALVERKEDLVYRVHVDQSEVVFYLMIEYQTQSDRFMALRILEYTLLVWQEHRRKSPTPLRLLPLVVPMVIYPGPGRWGAVRNLRDLIAIPELLQDWACEFVPNCGYCIAELGERSLGRLATGNLGRAILGILQRQRTGQAGYEAVEDLMKILFSNHQDRELKEIIQGVWSYVLWNFDLQKDDIKKIVQTHVQPNQQENYMSAAELLIAEGIQKGHILAQQQSVLEALEVRFGAFPAFVQTEILNVTGPETLKFLLRQAISCASLDEFLKALGT